MVGSLGPVVDGAVPDARRIAYIHSVGLGTGAVLMALMLTTLGAVIRSSGLGAILITVAALATATALAQVIFGMTPPQSRWQVPERWRRVMDPDILAVFYGVLLGFGVLTAVVTSAFWVFVALTPLVSPVTALTGWLAYALSRAVGFWSIARSLHADEVYLRHRSSRRLLIVASSTLASLAFVLTTLVTTS